MHLPFTACVNHVRYFCGFDLPSNAIKSDVFPDPVGPMIKLIQPRSKINSSSILRRNVGVEGVAKPSVPLDHVNVAARNPTLSR